MRPKTLILLVISLLLVVVLLQNMHPVRLALLFWSLELPLLLVVISSLLLGWALAWFMYLTSQRHKHKEIREDAQPTAPDS